MASDCPEPLKPSKCQWKCTAKPTKALNTQCLCILADSEPSRWSEDSRRLSRSKLPAFNERTTNSSHIPTCTGDCTRLHNTRLKVSTQRVLHATTACSRVTKVLCRNSDLDRDVFCLVRSYRRLRCHPTSFHLRCTTTLLGNLGIESACKNGSEHLSPLRRPLLGC